MSGIPWQIVTLGALSISILLAAAVCLALRFARRHRGGIVDMTALSKGGDPMRSNWEW